MGGIECYKKGNHGKELSNSAMIGFIQDENTCNFWFGKINDWIKILISTKTKPDILWETDDCLVESENFNSTQRYTSKNKRIVNSKTDSIYLHHYLMELS